MNASQREPWDENVVFISECYMEKYPTGKRNFEMVEFGPMAENCFVYIPKGANRDETIMERRVAIHDRLVRSVIDMVNKAIDQGRLVGLVKREI